jgi:hypothetical protein
VCGDRQAEGERKGEDYEIPNLWNAVSDRIDWNSCKDKPIDDHPPRTPRKQRHGEVQFRCEPTQTCREI